MQWTTYYSGKTVGERNLYTLLAGRNEKGNKAMEGNLVASHRITQAFRFDSVPLLGIYPNDTMEDIWTSLFTAIIISNSRNVETTQIYK